LIAVSGQVWQTIFLLFRHPGRGETPCVVMSRRYFEHHRSMLVTWHFDQPDEHIFVFSSNFAISYMILFLKYQALGL
jgi:hypothetical protein